MHISDLKKKEKAIQLDPADIKFAGDTASMVVEQLLEPKAFTKQRIESLVNIFNEHPSLHKLFLPQ